MAITVFILLYFAVDYSLYIIQDFFSFVKEVHRKNFSEKLLSQVFYVLSTKTPDSEKPRNR